MVTIPEGFIRRNQNSVAYRQYPGDLMTQAVLEGPSWIIARGIVLAVCARSTSDLGHASYVKYDPGGPTACSSI